MRALSIFLIVGVMLAAGPLAAGQESNGFLFDQKALTEDQLNSLVAVLSGLPSQ